MSKCINLALGKWRQNRFFIPKSNAEAEDAGYLLNYVFNETTHSSELVILDAQNFCAEPIARIALPQRVPFGFHGSWVPL